MSTVLELKTDIKRVFGDESGSFLEDADVLRWLNAGQLDIARKTDVLQTEFNGNTDGINNYVAVPALAISFMQVSLNNTLLQEYHISDDLDTNFSNKLSVPSGCYMVWNARVYFPLAVATQVLPYKLVYQQRPAILALDTDVPTIPVEFHEDLIRFCLAKAKEMEEDYGAADRFEADYNRRVMATRSEVATRNRNSYNSIRLLDND